METNSNNLLPIIAIIISILSPIVISIRLKYELEDFKFKINANLLFNKPKFVQEANNEFSVIIRIINRGNNTITISKLLLYTWIHLSENEIFETKSDIDLPFILSQVENKQIKFKIPQEIAKKVNKIKYLTINDIVRGKIEFEYFGMNDRKKLSKFIYLL